MNTLYSNNNYSRLNSEIINHCQYKDFYFLVWNFLTCKGKHMVCIFIYQNMFFLVRKVSHLCQINTSLITDEVFQMKDKQYLPVVSDMQCLDLSLIPGVVILKKTKIQFIKSWIEGCTFKIFTTVQVLFTHSDTWNNLQTYQFKLSLFRSGLHFEITHRLNSYTLKKKNKATSKTKTQNKDHKETLLNYQSFTEMQMLRSKWLLEAKHPFKTNYFYCVSSWIGLENTRTGNQST